LEGDAGMQKEKLFSLFKRKLIVSCLARHNKDFFNVEVLKALAKSVADGGAGALIVDGVNNINSVMEAVDIPIIGMNCREYEGFDCSITATLREVAELVEQTRADIILVDGTQRQHPEGDTGVEFIREVKMRYPGIILMADVSSFEEGVKAYEAGADLLIASMSVDSLAGEDPDYELINLLSGGVDIPVIAAGNIWEPSDAKRLLDNGAYAVVVGKAIINPYEITRNFVKEIENSSTK